MFVKVVTKTQTQYSNNHPNITKIRTHHEEYFCKILQNLTFTIMLLDLGSWLTRHMNSSARTRFPRFPHNKHSAFLPTCCHAYSRRTVFVHDVVAREETRKTQAQGRIGSRKCSPCVFVRTELVVDSKSAPCASADVSLQWIRWHLHRRRTNWCWF